MGVAPTVAMGPLAPSLIFLVTYKTTSVPILVLLSKSAQSISLSTLLQGDTTIKQLIITIHSFQGDSFWVLGFLMPFLWAFGSDYERYDSYS